MTLVELHMRVRTLCGPALKVNWALLSANICVNSWQRNVFLCKKEKLWRSDFTPGTGRQQVLQAACFAPVTPHRIHPPRCNTYTFTSFLSLLILPVNFQTTDFSYHQVASLLAILNTTLATQFPALPPSLFSIWSSSFGWHLFPRKFQHTTHVPTGFHLQFPSWGTQFLNQQEFHCNLLPLPLLVSAHLQTMLPSLFPTNTKSPVPNQFNSYLLLLYLNAVLHSIQVFLSVRGGITNRKGNNPL